MEISGVVTQDESEYSLIITKYSNWVDMMGPSFITDQDKFKVVIHNDFQQVNTDHDSEEQEMLIDKDSNCFTKVILMMQQLLLVGFENETLKQLDMVQYQLDAAAAEDYEVHNNFKKATDNMRPKLLKGKAYTTSLGVANVNIMEETYIAAIDTSVVAIVVAIIVAIA